MALTRVKINNFTVFSKCDISFVQGINIFIGENGTGKTHLMKLLYSACQAAKTDISFSHKLVRIFRPDELAIRRLVKRRAGTDSADVKVWSDKSNISIHFHTKTPKWEADVKGEKAWEKQSEDLTSTFIPAKEILSNAWNFEAAVSKGNIDFDETYLDIVTSAKIDISKGADNANRKKYLNILQGITDGKVAVENERFYLKPGNQSKIEFHLVAEGLRKVALLWQLIKNGTLEHGSVLFWDEPEANINPLHIPVIVDMLLELQRNGVQIFVSTHDYVLAKYFEVKKRVEDSVSFYSFYFSAQDKKNIEVEKNGRFSELQNNIIASSYDALLKEIYGQMME